MHKGHIVISFIHCGAPVLVAQTDIDAQVGADLKIVLSIPAPESSSRLVGIKETKGSGRVISIAQQEIGQIGHPAHLVIQSRRTRAGERRELAVKINLPMR